MELVQLIAGAVEGVDGYLVQVEVSRAEPVTGTGRTTVVGLPDAAVRESIDRVTPALFSSGLRHRPADHLVINLAPADRRKEGPAFDLAIAMGLASTMPANRLPPPPVDTLFLAELALDGTLRSCRGVLASAIAARESGLRRMVVAPANAGEAAVVEGLLVHAPQTLVELVEWVREGLAQAPVAQPAPRAPDGPEAPDLAEVRGQELAKRALVIAAAGAHNLLQLGSYITLKLNAPHSGNFAINPNWQSFTGRHWDYTDTMPLITGSLHGQQASELHPTSAPSIHRDGTT